MKNYFTPIPAGTKSVRLRGSATANGPFFAQDLAIWARAGGSSPAPTPTATSTAGAQTASVSGTLALEGRSSASGITVTASPGGKTAVTAANGTFTISGLATNQSYSFTASAPGFLRLVRSGVKVATSNLSLPSGTLRAGDIDADGAVTIVDVSLVSGLFGLAPGQSAADLNASGAVDIVDVSLTAANFGLSGPTPW
jgi:hypothetical protein